VKFVSRAEWGARPPRSASTNITPSSCTAHYGGNSPWGGKIGDHSRCPVVVRNWQAFHMDGRGWADLAYNMVVCPHGYVFQGRGHGVRSAANGTNQGNQNSYAICYLAGAGDPLTADGKRAFLDAALVLGQPLTKVHSDWFATSCPGDEVRTWVRSGTPIAVPAPTPVHKPDPEDEDMVMVIDPKGGIWSVAGVWRKPLTVSPAEAVKAYDLHARLGGKTLDCRQSPEFWSHIVTTTKATS
jgi:hypothetical protein